MAHNRYETTKMATSARQSPTEACRRGSCCGCWLPIFLSSFAILALAIQLGDAQPTMPLANLPSVNEFNVSELNLYNNIVTCVAEFKFEFVECNQQLQQLGKLTNQLNR